MSQPRVIWRACLEAADHFAGGADAAEFIVTVRRRALIVISFVLFLTLAAHLIQASLTAPGWTHAKAIGLAAMSLIGLAPLFPAMASAVPLAAGS